MLTKFERARRQTIKKWKEKLFSTGVILNCGFCLAVPNCCVCPVEEQCGYVYKHVEAGLPRAMAVLLWLMSDDCKSLDDGSM